MPPTVRYDNSLLEVGLEGDFTYGGMVSTSAAKKLIISSKCKSKEDAFIELQFGIEKQIPISILFKRSCGVFASTSLPRSQVDNHPVMVSGRSLIGSLFHFIIFVAIWLIKLTITVIALVGVAMLADHLLQGKIFQAATAARNSQMNKEPREAVELKPLVTLKHYGTLN